MVRTSGKAAQVSGLFGLLAASVSAQEVIGPTPAPSPTFRNTAPVTTVGDPSTPSLPAPGVSEIPGQREVVQFLRNPFQWGPFQFRPHANYRFTYGNGINASPGQQEKTAQHQISPGLLLVSQHLSLNYTPTLTYYSSDAFEDTLDHAASITANYTYGDWNFGLSHSYTKSSTPLIETAAQTDRQAHSTGASAHWQYSDKTSFDFSLSQQIQSAEDEDLNNSTQWSTMNWVNYHFSQKTDVGFGLGGGYVDMETGSDMTFEQIQARVGWNPGQKLRFDLHGGVEIRQFLDNDQSDLVNPIMGASAAYTPWEPTTFTLSASRSVDASFLQSQVVENTQVTAAVQQRLLGKLFLNLSGGFRTSEYQESGNEVQTDRSDDYTFVSAGLSTQILRKISASLFYQHSENSSSAEGFGFTSDQYGFQLGYRF